MPPLLELAGVCAGYGGREVLHGISLSVPDDGIVTLLGANGAGKSTTLRVISGLLNPSAGSVRFAGEDLAGRAAEDRVRLGICQVPEGRRIFPRLTVRENLLMGGYLCDDQAELDARLARVHELFPVLAERADQPGATLSGGEQQMLAIGRALMGRPRLLLLDEPSLGLAPQLVERIFSIVREIHARGCAVVLVEQNARQALRLARFGYVMETGRVLLEGPAESLARDEVVRKAYLGG